jgi:hypothetical protein
VNVLGAVLLFLGAAVITWGTIRYGWRLTVADAAGDALMAAGAFALRLWLLAAIFALAAVLAALRLWRRRKRRRAPRELGYKARARIADLVRKVRESARSRPVLRPQPGGVS